MGPLEATKPWQTEQVSGVVRFRDRVYLLVCANSGSAAKETKINDSNRVSDSTIERAMHKAIKKVTQDIENLSFNTAISALMIYSNFLASNYVHGRTPAVYLDTLVLLVSPFAPHLGEECWELLGHKTTLAYHKWPTYNESMCVDELINLSIQVNGKLRGTIQVSINADEAVVLKMAKEQVSRYLSGQDIKKTIYVMNKTVSIVTSKPQLV